MLGGDRWISEPSAVCISISLPMYDPQKLHSFHTKLQAFLTKKAAMHLELWLEHIELVGGFSSTHLKKYAQVVKLDHISPKKHMLKQQKIKPPPESMVEFGSSWWVWWLYCPRNLPFFRDHLHRLPRARAWSKELEPQSIHQTGRPFRESNSKQKKSVAGWWFFTNPPDKYARQNWDIISPKYRGVPKKIFETST